VDDHVVSNRSVWDADAENWVEQGRESWQSEHIRWGIWKIPEAELSLLPDVGGLDVIDLGCGTGPLSAWLVRRGAHAVGLDNSGAQLATAARFQREFHVPFPLVQGDAEQLPFHDGSFDLAVSEYGAVVWCDPYRWIPEAGRILRPGGRLMFLANSYLLMLTYPEEEGACAEERLQRDHFGMHRFGWESDPGAVGFHIPHGEMVRLLRASGFEVEGLVEIGAPRDAVAPGDAMATVEWARRWPNEEAWIARKRQP
jgi:SAM-dependent methyltransferase